MKNGKGNSVDHIADSSFSVKTVLASLGLAFVFQAAFIQFQDSPSFKLPSQIAREQTTTITGLKAQNQKLLETAEVIATGFEQLWSKAEHLVDGKQKFYMEDFLSYFGIEPIHNTVIDPSLKALVDAHDITTDDLYKNNEDEMKYRIQKYSTWIDRGSEGDKRFYVKYTDVNRGYGLYADTYIRKGDVLGVYAAELTNSSYTTDYTWTYSSVIKNEQGKPIDLGLDSKEKGNWFLFVNHADKAKDLNCEVIYVPYKNIWHVMYVASKAISKDQEILVSYGESYWETRKLAGIQHIEVVGEYKNVLDSIQKLRAGEV